MNINNLAAAFPPEVIHWRAQTLTRDGDKALALAYIDARDVMDRLDMVCGPENWQSGFTETATGRVLCRLEILIGDRWIAKTDGAGNTAVEGEKGGISDALKRAAVQWGIGRYLYDLGNVWAPCESRDNNGRKQWVKWKPEAAKVFAYALARLGAPATEKPTGPINDKTREWVANQVDARGVFVGDLCKAFNVTTIKALTYEQLDAVKDWLRANRKAA